MEQRNPSTVNDIRRKAVLVAAVLVVYFAAGKFGLSFFGLIHPSASAVWLPTGVAIGTLLVLGRWIWPAIFVGAFLVNVTTEGSTLTSLGVAAGNTLDGVIAAELVRRFAGGLDVFVRAIDILKFAGLAALLSTAISATIGVTSLTVGGYAAPSEFGTIWFTWWLGDASGAMLVTPLIVLWSKRPRGPAEHAAREAVLLYVSVASVGGLTFFHPAVASYPLAFLCFAPLVWGALRFGPREVATAVALLSAIAVAATAIGQGPFVLPTANESLLVLQAFMGLIAMMALPMAALTLERSELLGREHAARVDADAASREKDEFLAILSHELRNPLSAISTAAAALDAGCKSGEESQRCVGVIQRQTLHLARLLDDLFDIGRVTANRMSLQKEPLDLARVVERHIRELAGVSGTERIILDLQPAWVHADRDRIDQIVANLVGNSIRYTQPDARIRVSVCVRNGEAVLGVEDEGIGIRPELLPHVFDAFRQGERGLDRNPGGLGIGLTLVRRFAMLHGGSVEGHSGGPGRGSAFVVRLPLAVPTEAKRHADDTEVPAIDERLQRRYRLLIIEDNDDARHGLRALLEGGGHEVREATDGEAGVAAALELAPDVALVDIGLPLLDGYEVARRIRAGNPGIRLIAVTGYGHDDDKRRARDAGYDAHLLKPVTVDRLRHAIEAALGNGRDHSAASPPSMPAEA